jgi:hypothetical protein
MRRNHITPEYADRMAAVRLAARSARQPACSEALERAVLPMVVENGSVGFDLGIYDPSTGEIFE